MINGGKKLQTDKKISIITVVYNGIDSIEKTIVSVVNQTYDNFEYIIIDGGSTDGTLDIIKRYEDKIDYWQSEQDNGIYDAMNKGIGLSRGKWINFMNAGDTFYNEETVRNVADNLTDVDDIVYGITYDYKKNIYCNTKITKLKLMKGEMIGHQSIFAKKDTFLNNMFDTSYKIIADKVWLCKCYGKKNIKKINIPICYFDDTGVSSVNRQALQQESRSFLTSHYGWKINIIYGFINVRHKIKSLLVRLFLIVSRRNNHR